MNDIGRLLSWQGLLRIVPLYFVMMGLYNYGVGAQEAGWQQWLISTLVMTAVISAATMGVLAIITVSNRGGLGAIQAQRLSSSGNNKGAIERYNEALRHDPDGAEALVGRAEILAGSGQIREALADLDHAIAVTPHVINFPSPILLRAYMERGRLRDMEGDRRGAMEDWRQANRAAPGSPDPYILRGRAALEVGDWTTGRRLLTQGIGLLDRRLKGDQRNGANDRAAQLNMRGLAYNLLGEYKPAMSDLEQALSLQPDSWVAHFNLGATYTNMGFLEQALIELTTAIRLNPAAATAAKRSRAYARLAEDPAFLALVGGGGEGLLLPARD